MTITGKLRKGNINKYLIYKICGNLHNPGRLQMAAAFMAGMVITAALAYFGADKDKLTGGENGKTIMPEQQNIPGYYMPEEQRDILPDDFMFYELVYAFTEGALISG
jgi:hypothetical protein